MILNSSKNTFNGRILWIIIPAVISYFSTICWQYFSAIASCQMYLFIIKMARPLLSSPGFVSQHYIYMTHKPVTNQSLLHLFFFHLSTWVYDQWIIPIQLTSVMPATQCEKSQGNAALTKDLNLGLQTSMVQTLPIKVRSWGHLTQSATTFLQS